MKIIFSSIILLLASSTYADADQPKLRGALQQQDHYHRADKSKKKVLIIGAGMSGLTAARALLAAGNEVEIIEYQDRIGGRVWSPELSRGGYTELGAGHFRSNMPNVLNYISYYDLDLTVMNDGLPIYANVDKHTGDLFYGRASDLTTLEKWKLHYNETNITPTSLMNYYLHLNGLDTSRVLEESYPSEEEIEKFDGVMFDQLMIQSGASEGLLQILVDHCGGILDASALTMLPDLAYHMGDQNVFRIHGGNHMLPQAMAREIEEIAQKNVIHTSKNVTNIDHSNEDEMVKVTAVDRESGEEVVYEADEVISTVSFQLFKENDVTIYPDWSPSKRKMFENFEWGNSMKVVCQTESPTWLNKNAHGWPMAGTGDRIWERVIDITGASRHGNLFFYLNGDNSKTVAEMFPKEESGAHLKKRAEYVINEFNKDMPGLIEECIEPTSIYWDEVEWIKASFGEPPLGEAYWMIKEWEKPEGDRIWLSGDFTSMKTGWVEGAIEAGMRVAKAIDSNAKMVFEE